MSSIKYLELGSLCDYILQLPMLAQSCSSE